MVLVFQKGKDFCFSEGAVRMNETKTCGRCKQTLCITLFGPNKARPDGLQSHCRACKRLFQAAWYAKNKARHAANVNRKRKERAVANQARLIEYLSGHPCVECGEIDPLLLECDHVRGEKRDEVAQMICSGLGWQTILAELEKCEVRCVRCHRRRTAHQFRYARTLLLPQARNTTRISP